MSRNKNRIFIHTKAHSPLSPSSGSLEIPVSYHGRVLVVKQKKSSAPVRFASERVGTGTSRGWYGFEVASEPVQSERVGVASESLVLVLVASERVRFGSVRVLFCLTVYMYLCSRHSRRAVSVSLVFYM